MTRYENSLDNYRTGHYGEDQWADSFLCESCGTELAPDEWGEAICPECGKVYPAEDDDDS
jgi:rubrerythrin